MKIEFDLKVMKEICLADVEAFTKIKGAVVKETTHGPLIYIDRGSKILAIAHLDSTPTADGANHFYNVKIGKDDIIFNAQLDDRLGAYVILDLLPKLGVTTDILLTVGEESGNSTAQFFEPTKKYRWMFQFDRHGDDVVYYQYGEKKFNDLLGKYFKRPGHGAFTDICYMEHVGCKGFNIACGYEDNHSLWAKADLNVLREQVERFLQFYSKHKREHFPHEKKKYVPTKYIYRYPQHYTGMQDEWDYQDWETGGRGKIYYPPKDDPKVPEIKNEICIVCGDIVKIPDKTQKIRNVCSTCLPHLTKCVACGNKYAHAEIIPEKYGNHYVCRNCIAFGSILTTVKCPMCDMALYTYELKDGKCRSCRDFPHLAKSRRI